jgi:hypothetical protein
LPRADGRQAPHQENKVQRKIISFELNEVPFRVLDEFCKWRPQSVLAQKLSSCFQYHTHTQDVSHLTPWMTWPGVHRGVNDEQHLIQNFGQDLSEVDRQFPPIWKLLAQGGVSVGMFGSLHSYPMPKDLENYSFYVPDTFAAGSECFPQKLEIYQEFNLRMARESPRNVAKGVPWMSALKMLARAPDLGFKLQTLTSVAGQLISERAQKWRIVRRRTFQAVLAFDVFMKQLESSKPSYTAFFSNHVASSMHRFWAAKFPEDYDVMGYDEDWIRTYQYEIDWTMQKADEMFARLVKFADANSDYQVWLTTSMGQAAHLAEPLETQLYITDLSKFMTALGFVPGQWKPRAAMMPSSNVFVAPGLEGRLHEALSKLMIDEKPVNFETGLNGFFAIHLGQKNLYKKPPYARVDGRSISFAELGMENVEIADQSNTSGYHIPDGCLLIYDPRANEQKAARPHITTLDIAPAILKNFALPIPAYMQKPTALAR